MDAEYEITEPEQERTPYSDAQRAKVLAQLLEIMGGEPSEEMLRLAEQRDEEFARRRSHAA
ncbi:hypothetical protein HS041_29585 [Planomonospora sp. ID67723]|uniref:hypothetical protein n=1 Tax=Planomonospora sp. ID67723 TaxID=2738134 RepID=UPI0018C41B9F|nr:hypothetical protein [Planomonospora sp. ID67723]MBG0831866.1 hypothetical protein [Planomonospora sp. ID67723]